MPQEPVLPRDPLWEDRFRVTQFVALVPVLQIASNGSHNRPSLLCAWTVIALPVILLQMVILKETLNQVQLVRLVDEFCYPDLQRF